MVVSTSPGHGLRSLQAANKENDGVSRLGPARRTRNACAAANIDPVDPTDHATRPTRSSVRFNPVKRSPAKDKAPGKASAPGYMRATCSSSVRKDVVDVASRRRPIDAVADNSTLPSFSPRQPLLSSSPQPDEAVPDFSVDPMLIDLDQFGITSAPVAAPPADPEVKPRAPRPRVDFRPLPPPGGACPFSPPAARGCAVPAPDDGTCPSPLIKFSPAPATASAASRAHPHPAAACEAGLAPPSSPSPPGGADGSVRPAAPADETSHGTPAAARGRDSSDDQRVRSRRSSARLASRRGSESPSPCLRGVTKGFLASGASSPPSHLAHFLASAASGVSVGALKAGAPHLAPIPLSLSEAPPSAVQASPLAAIPSPARLPLSRLAGSPAPRAKALEAPIAASGSHLPIEPPFPALNHLGVHMPLEALGSSVMPSSANAKKVLGGFAPKRRSARLSAIQFPIVGEAAPVGAQGGAAQVGILIDFSEEDGADALVAGPPRLAGGVELEAAGQSVDGDERQGGVEPDAWPQVRVTRRLSVLRQAAEGGWDGGTGVQRLNRSPVAVEVVDAAAPMVEPPPRRRSRSPAPARSLPSGSNRPAAVCAKPKPSAVPAQESGRRAARATGLAALPASRGGGEPFKTLGAACEMLGGVDEDREWERRVAAIRALPRLLMEAGSRPGVGGAQPLEAALRALGKPLAAQLADLRSTVVSTLCGTLVALAAEHGSALAPLVPSLLPALLRNHCVAKAPIAKPSVEAAGALVSAAPSVEAMAVLLISVGSPHHQTRRGVAELCGRLCASGLELSHAQGAALANATRALVTDGDTTVRTAAAITFWVLRARFVLEADSILPKIQPPQQKLIQRHKPANA